MEESADNKTEEIWMPIKGYEDSYQISNFGRVRSIDRIAMTGNPLHETRIKGKIKSNVKLKNGYMSIVLYNHCSPCAKYIHRLVAETFIPNPENKREVNHIDGDKTNNHVPNLEWVTSSENKIHAYENNLMGDREGAVKKIIAKKQVPIIMDDNRVFNGVNEAGREMDISPSCISRVLKGKATHAKGHTFKYAR